MIISSIKAPKMQNQRDKSRDKRQSTVPPSLPPISRRATTHDPITLTYGAPSDLRLSVSVMSDKSSQPVYKHAPPVENPSDWNADTRVHITKYQTNVHPRPVEDQQLKKTRSSTQLLTEPLPAAPIVTLNSSRAVQLASGAKVTYRVMLSSSDDDDPTSPSSAVMNTNTTVTGNANPSPGTSTIMKTSTSTGVGAGMGMGAQVDTEVTAWMQLDEAPVEEDEPVPQSEEERGREADSQTEEEGKGEDEVAGEQGEVSAAPATISASTSPAKQRHEKDVNTSEDTKTNDEAKAGDEAKAAAVRGPVPVPSPLGYCTLYLQVTEAHYREHHMVRPRTSRGTNIGTGMGTGTSAGNPGTGNGNLHANGQNSPSRPHISANQGRSPSRMGSRAGTRTENSSGMDASSNSQIFFQSHNRNSSVEWSNGYSNGYETSLTTQSPGPTLEPIPPESLITSIPVRNWIPTRSFLSSCDFCRTVCDGVLWELQWAATTGAYPGGSLYRDARRHVVERRGGESEVDGDCSTVGDPKSACVPVESDLNDATGVIRELRELRAYIQHEKRQEDARQAQQEEEEAQGRARLRRVSEALSAVGVVGAGGRPTIPARMKLAMAEAKLRAQAEADARRNKRIQRSNARMSGTGNGNGMGTGAGSEEEEEEEEESEEEEDEEVKIPPVELPAVSIAHPLYTLVFSNPSVVETEAALARVVDIYSDAVDETEDEALGVFSAMAREEGCGWGGVSEVLLLMDRDMAEIEVQRRKRIGVLSQRQPSANESALVNNSGGENGSSGNCVGSDTNSNDHSGPTPHSNINSNTNTANATSTTSITTTNTPAASGGSVPSTSSATDSPSAANETDTSSVSHASSDYSTSMASSVAGVCVEDGSDVALMDLPEATVSLPEVADGGNGNLYDGSTNNIDRHSTTSTTTSFPRDEIGSLCPGDGLRGLKACIDLLLREARLVMKTEQQCEVVRASMIEGCEKLLFGSDGEAESGVGSSNTGWGRRLSVTTRDKDKAKERDRDGGVGSGGKDRDRERERKLKLPKTPRLSSGLALAAATAAAREREKEREKERARQSYLLYGNQYANSLPGGRHAWTYEEMYGPSSPYSLSPVPRPKPKHNAGNAGGSPNASGDVNGQGPFRALHAGGNSVGSLGTSTGTGVGSRPGLDSIPFIPDYALDRMVIPDSMNDDSNVATAEDSMAEDVELMLARAQAQAEARALRVREQLEAARRWEEEEAKKEKEREKRAQREKEEENEGKKDEEDGVGREAESATVIVLSPMPRNGVDNTADNSLSNSSGDSVGEKEEVEAREEDEEEAEVEEEVKMKEEQEVDGYVDETREGKEAELETNNEEEEEEGVVCAMEAEIGGVSSVSPVANTTTGENEVNTTAQDDDSDDTNGDAIPDVSDAIAASVAAEDGAGGVESNHEDDDELAAVETTPDVIDETEVADNANVIAIAASANDDDDHDDGNDDHDEDEDYKEEEEEEEEPEKPKVEEVEVDEEPIGAEVEVEAKAMMEMEVEVRADVDDEDEEEEHMGANVDAAGGHNAAVTVSNSAVEDDHDEAEENDDAEEESEAVEEKEYGEEAEQEAGGGVAERKDDVAEEEQREEETGEVKEGEDMAVEIDNGEGEDVWEADQVDEADEEEEEEVIGNVGVLVVNDAELGDAVDVNGCDKQAVVGMSGDGEEAEEEDVEDVEEENEDKEKEEKEEYEGAEEEESGVRTTELELEEEQGEEEVQDMVFINTPTTAAAVNDGALVSATVAVSASVDEDEVDDYDGENEGEDEDEEVAADVAADDVDEPDDEDDEEIDEEEDDKVENSVETPDAAVLIDADGTEAGVPSNNARTEVDEEETEEKQKVMAEHTMEESLTMGDSDDMMVFAHVPDTGSIQTPVLVDTKVEVVAAVSVARQGTDSMLLDASELMMSLEE